MFDKILNLFGREPKEEKHDAGHAHNFQIVNGVLSFDDNEQKEPES